MYLAADVVVLGLRALSFIAIFQAAGAALFLWLFERELTASLGSVRVVAKVATVCALVVTIAQHVLTPARMAGSFAETFDPSLGALLAQSNVGPAHGVRVVGLGLLAVSLEEQGRFNRVGSIAGISLTLFSFALMGHTTIHDARWALAPLLLVHVVVAAFWFGALWPLNLVAARESIEATGRIVARFSALAVRSVPLILVCGVVMAALFIRSLDALLTPYGGMIVLKAAAYAALLGLATLNRWRLGPAILAGKAAGLAAFIRVVKVEWVLLASVLAATALMTGLLAPENLHGSFSSAHEEDAAGTEAE